MLTWLSRRVVKDAWLVLAAWALVLGLLVSVALSGLGGSTLTDRLLPSATTVTGSESAQGQDIIEALAGDGTTVTLMVTGIDLTSAQTQEKVAQALGPAHKDLGRMVGETRVVDPFVVPGLLSSPAAQVLASKNRDGFIIVVTVDPNGSKVADPDDRAYAQEVRETVQDVEDRLRKVPGELAGISPGVRGVVSDEELQAAAITDQVGRDVLRGMAIAAPVALILSSLLLGSVLAALAPVAAGLLCAAGSLGMLWAVSLPRNQPALVVGIVPVVAMALATGYGLLLTSRYRGEMARFAQEMASGTEASLVAGHRPPTRLATMRGAIVSAGRAVVLSGLTVGIAMGALVVVGPDILRSVGMAGAGVVLLAVLLALTLVPAILVLLGDRPRNAFSPRTDRMRQPLRQVARLSTAMPWVVMVGVAIVLVILAAPVRQLHMVASTNELIPSSSDQTTYLRTLETDYPAAREQDATVILSITGQSATEFINGPMAQVKGIDEVMSSATAGDYTVLYLDLAGSPSSADAAGAVEQIRSLKAPADMWVTGNAAEQVDFRSAVMGGLPWVLLLMVASTFILLFLSTGSVLAPVKAIVINSMSLAAALGVTVWVFQEGHLASLLGFSPVGGLEAYVVVVAATLGFGMAMDDEVILLRGMQSAQPADDDSEAAAEAAVSASVARSGWAITGSGIVLAAVFSSFLGAKLLVIQELALAMAIIVLLDSTLVRNLLVPSTMALLGRWNWWAPRPMLRARAWLRGE